MMMFNFESRKMDGSSRNKFSLPSFFCRVLVVVSLYIFVVIPTAAEQLTPMTLTGVKQASSGAGASEQPAMAAATMNGISFKEYNGFWDKWHFVTTRYRSDIKEMRFIYANDIAWNRITESRKDGITFPSDYPDGAAFAKVAFSLVQDPIFESSLMPDKPSRYQIMVKDSAKYSTSTQSWGYAIFTSKGIVGDPDKPELTSKEVTTACSACHEMASSRGYVFLGNFNPWPARPNPIQSTYGAASPYQLFQYRRVPVSAYPEVNYTPILEKQFDLVMLPKTRMFQGTLNEAIPSLIKHFKEVRLPTVLISEDRSRWIGVFPDPKDSSCVNIAPISRHVCE